MAGRYVVEHALGKGGMGSVYAVRDTKLSRVVALKYLKREAARENGAAASLFQREFHTLAQLRHPRVIQVYDYGIDGQRPFYTMELLDGRDLRELAPVPWRRACQLLRDVASSLALLHSRRLLHRDLSPRNVRCTRDGQAKLIDFGTMTPMGVARDVAGTPPYMAPEAVHGHALDARTDLYGLGALAYWTLTGFDAYPARDTRELRALWMKPVVQPSTWVREIPEALDALVMSLLSLDPQARPSHVAEVLERLTAIAGLEPIEPMDVARAYVATPTLVGHGETLASFHKRLVRASRGRGSALHVEGLPGHGRSRLLESLALEAKLCGVSVAYAQGLASNTAQRGELAVIRGLLEGVVEAMPELALAAFAPRAAALGHLLPQLAARLPEPPALEQRATAAERAAMLDQAARAFIGELAEQRALMLAVDDADEADEASIACLAWLGREAADRKLVVCTSARPAQPLSPLGALAENAAKVALAPFDAEQTERLLRSVFGDAPHVRAVAEWAQALSQGVPGTILELVQYLVDHRLARYERGSWTLPTSVRDQPLPASVEQAHEQLVMELSPLARSLAAQLALVTDFGALDFEETLRLGAPARQDDVYRALLELEAARVIVVNAGTYALRRRGLERALHKLLGAAEQRACHALLGAIYGERSGGSRDEALLLRAHHLLLAGEPAPSFEALCAVGSVESTAFGRTPASAAMHVAALEHGKAAGAAPQKLYGLQRALVQLASSTDLGLAPLASGALARLLQDSGVAALAAGPARDDEAAVARVREALALARLRYETTAPAARGLDPAHALSEIGYVAGVLASVHATRRDAAALVQLARDIAPLKPLSVGFEVLHEIVEQAAEAVSGGWVLPKRLRTLAKLEASAFEPEARASAQVALTHWIAMDEAALGKPSALSRAEWLAAQPSLAGLAARVRGVYFLFSGDEAGAEGCRKQRELFALNDPWGAALSDARGVVYEAWGYYACGSVLGMRRVLHVVTEHAARLPAWQSDVSFVRGLYELLRGEPKRALVDLEQSGVAGAHALALLAGGEAAQASAVIEDVLARPRTLFAPHRFALCAARALALAERGEARAAAEQLAGEIAAAERDGVQGMLLCMLHEAAARIAILCDDRASFRAHVRKLGATYGRGTSGLRARFEHLGAVARRALMTVPPPAAAEASEESSAASIDVRTQIEPAAERAERATRALRLLAESARAATGYLFGMQAAGLRLSGKLGVTAPPDGIEDMLGFYMNAELDSGAAVPHTATGTFTSAPVDLVAWINDGEQLYFPVLLSCMHEGQRVIAGVAVLGLDVQREPHVPEALIAEISRSLIEAGDVVYAKAAE